MTQFLDQPAWTKRFWDELQALKSRVNAISTGAGEVRSTGGGVGQVGVLRTHGHEGTGDGGAIADRALLFMFPDEDLAAGIFLPRPSYRLLTKFVAPTSETDQRFTVTAGTVGSGANSDVVLESSTDRSGWTIRATINLDAQVEDSVASFGGWTWNPVTEYLRVRCTLMDAGTAPADVSALFDWD